MADEPSNKKAKLSNEESDKKFRDTLAEVDHVQAELDAINEKATEEILKVEQKFVGLRRPIYEKRAEHLKQLEGFWPTAIINHPQLQAYIAEVEEPLLMKIVNLEVEDFEDIKSGYRIKFTFGPNEYIENDTVTKEIFLTAEPAHSKVSEVRWKEGNNLLKKVGENRMPVRIEQQTFVEWLMDTVNDPTVDEFAEVVKDDLFPNPLQYYLMPDIEDIDDDGDLSKE